MSNTVFQARRSTISGTRPTTSSIQTGELAINLPDGILFSTNGSTVFEIGANNTTHNVTGNSYAVNVYSTGTINAVAHTVGSGVAANSSGFFSNAGFFSTLNGQKITFTSLAGGSNVYFTQQNDDNFVFYTTNTINGTRPVWSIFANSITSSLTISTPAVFNANVTIGALIANGSIGTLNQVLTSNGTGTFWSSPGAASVNTTAQYTWSNTQTFSSNVTFSSFILGNNIQASNGFISLGSYNNTFSHGIVMDYVTGMGRISVGPADGITFYNGNVATTATMTISNTGNVGIGNTVPATMLQIGVNYGVIAQTIASTNAISVNCASGNYFIATANGSATTITFTSVPANTVYAMVIRLANGGVNTFTWSSSPKWPSGSAPTVSSNTDIFTFVTENGGTTWYGVQSMIDVR
jgi:hypothetical protein